MSPDATLRAILFDIGRVIVRVDYDRALRTLGSSAGRSGQEVWQLISSDPRMRDLQEGRVTPQEWHEHLSRRLGMHLGFDEFIVAWNSALVPQTMIPDAVFAEAGRYRLGLLSNTDPIHVALIESTFSFPRFFPVRIYSCQVGMSKPDPAIYRLAIDSLAAVPAYPSGTERSQRAPASTLRHSEGPTPVGVEESLLAAPRLRPEEILYIDDVPEFLNAGQRAGMQGLLFTGAEALMAELRRRGIVAGANDPSAALPWWLGNKQD